MNKLKKIAENIPALGAHGIKDQLTQYAREVKEGLGIVEIGVWLGASTAYLSIGAENKNTVDVYDRFQFKPAEAERAQAEGTNIQAGENTLPIVKKNLEEFPHNIVYHRCDIRKATWDKGPIGLYVDDAAKQPKLWNHVVQTFFPHLIDGAIVLLADYLFFETTGNPLHKCQYEYIQKNKQHFEMLPDIKTKHARAFKHWR